MWIIGVLTTVILLLVGAGIGTSSALSHSQSSSTGGSKINNVYDLFINLFSIASTNISSVNNTSNTTTGTSNSM
jgi:glycerol uptake facilitator-like aquaporin